MMDISFDTFNLRLACRAAGSPSADLRPSAKYRVASSCRPASRYVWAAEEAEAEARQLHVADDIRFLGRLDTVAPLLQATDLFLLPSQAESFGLAALEAMACGVVPLLPDRLAYPELLGRGNPTASRCRYDGTVGGLCASLKRLAELKGTDEFEALRQAQTSTRRPSPPLPASFCVLPVPPELAKRVWARASHGLWGENLPG